MSGWSLTEAHCLEGEFSHKRAEKIESNVEAKSNDIVYKSCKRIVGKRGYNAKPKVSEIHKLSDMDNVAVAIVQANDTSDTGNTELVVDGRIIESYEDDRRCRSAARRMQYLYGIYLYASYYWKHINCDVEIDNSQKTDGRISVKKSFNRDVQVDFVQSRENERDLRVSTHLDEKNAKSLVEKIRDATQ